LKGNIINTLIKLKSSGLSKSTLKYVAYSRTKRTNRLLEDIVKHHD